MMDKRTFNIPQDSDGKWGSYISKYQVDSGKIPLNGFTKNSRNFITAASGQVEKPLGGTIWNPNSLLSGPALDQYEGIFASGQRLLIVNDAGTLKASTGNGMFSTITSGFTNPANFEFATSQNRVYGDNGVDNPIVMDTTTSYGGVSYVFTTAKTKTMGAQAPSSAPTATRNTDNTNNQVPNGSHTYKITFMYYGTEESNGSTASAVCVNDNTHTSNSLTSIPVGGYGVTARRIYRDDNNGIWLLLDTISNNTATTYTDILPVGATPTPIPTDNGVPPIFKYIAPYLDRLFVIDITGKIISWSLPGQPDIFRAANVLAGPQDDVMTAIYIFNGIPWVFGQHTVGVILGSDDGSFYYSPKSVTVGCADNRTIQTRTIVSVPTLIWLSALPNKGLYYSNGSTVQYLSDYIEDLTFNLAQVSYLQRQNSQDTQGDFQAGTSTPSIDLLSNPGAIQTINPTALYNDATDWATGAMVNIAIDGDQLGVPVGSFPTLSQGSLGGNAQISGSNLTLPTGSNFTGESHGQSSRPDFFTQVLNGYHRNQIAQAFVPTLTGTLNTISNLSFNVETQTSGSANIDVSIYSDSGGTPGSAIATQSFSHSCTTGPNDVVNAPTLTFNTSLTGGTTYWIVITLGQTGPSSPLFVSAISITGGNPWSVANPALARVSPGAWSTFTPPNPNVPVSIAGAYAYTTTPVVDSGTWTSPVVDTRSATVSSGMSLTISGTYPASTSSSVLVQGSNDQSAWTTTDTLSSPNGATSLTGGTYRYWRTIITISTTDNRNVPLVSASALRFNVQGTWTSPAILCTTDITTLDALTTNTILPAGTSATITIATSTDNITYSSFTSLGSAVPHKYAKIKVTLNTDSGNTVSPTLVEAELDWTVVGKLTSSIVDTGVTPAGWGLFQYAQVGTTGTISAEFRSAASSGGIPGATFTSVGNGTYPTSSPLEFFQWRLTLTAHANVIPVVDSVTVNWLLTSGANVRAASLFFNKSYYLAVATTGSTHNNLLIELDYEGNWRIHNYMSPGTLGTYFNDAFYGDATSGKILNAFKLPTENGTNIQMDARLKCFDMGDNQRLKNPRALKIQGANTGTTIHAYYSLDKGVTWVEMLNSSGTTGYVTASDGETFVEYFVPNYDGVSSVTGRTILYRVTSVDAFPCQISQFTPSLFVHKGKAISEAMS